MVKRHSRIFITVLIFVILIPVGFYTKFYSGFGHEWVNNKLGGVFYEIFWCLLFFILLNKSKPLNIAIWVFIISSILEFVQLLNSSLLLDIIRSNFIGQTIIGSSFSWSDFPYYLIGSAIGYCIMILISKE